MEFVKSWKELLDEVQGDADILMETLIHEMSTPAGNEVSMEDYLWMGECRTFLYRFRYMTLVHVITLMNTKGIEEDSTAVGDLYFMHVESLMKEIDLIIKFCRDFPVKDARCENYQRKLESILRMCKLKFQEYISEILK